MGYMYLMGPVLGPPDPGVTDNPLTSLAPLTCFE